MNQIILRITQNLIDGLPEGNQYYRLDELYELGLPSFLVKRIEIELKRNLADSMILPKTDWANIESERVQESWEKFVRAIRAEAHLPASYAKTVIETAVADVLEMLVQPRKNIPEIMYGAEDELGYEQLCDRVQLIVVYTYFSSLLPRYMQKKGLEQLSQTQCIKVIRNADQKLTKSYSPLNWAQMLEPLFKLTEGKVDSDLLRLFFEDKDITRLAHQFDELNESVDRAHFIEILSSPEQLDFGEGNEVPSISESQSAEEAVTGEEKPLEKELRPVEEEAPEPEQETEADEESEKQNASAEIEQEDDTEKEDNLNAIFARDPESEEEIRSPEAESDSGLYSVFLEKENEDDAHKIQEQKKYDPDVALTEEPRPAQSHKKELDSDDVEPNETKEFVEGPEETKQESDSEIGTPSPEEVQKSPKEEESPMWMNYMSKEEIEEYNKQGLDEPKDDEPGKNAKGFSDEPIIDLTEPEASEDEKEELKKLLADGRDVFVNELFKGSDRAYNEAVNELAGLENWGSAMNYIDEHIFKRNLIDRYSEAAVDLTDRLQTYFNHKSDSQ